MNKTILLLLISFFSLPLVTGITDQVTQWTFDNDDITDNNNQTGSGIYDNKLMMLGNPTSGQDGIISESYSFDGINDYAQAQNEQNYDFDGYFHVIAWVNTSGNFSSGQWQIVTKFDGSTQNYILQAFNGQLLYSVYGGTSSVTALNSTEWQFMEGIYNSSGVYACVNLICGSSVARGGSGLNNAPLEIGARNGGNFPWDGKIDSVIIYNRSLSQVERSQLYNGGQGFDPTDTNITYKNKYDSGGSIYSREIAYTINFSECPTNISVTRYINGVAGTTNNTVCTGSGLLFNGSYRHSTEGEYNIYFNITTTNSTVNNAWIEGNTSVQSDLTNPSIRDLRIVIQPNFGSSSATIIARCNDTIAPNPFYNVTFNNTVQVASNQTNNFNYTNSVMPQDGDNDLYFFCSDHFGNTTSSVSASASVKNIYIIDERNASAFDISNVSQIKLFLDDNSSFYDFKSNGNVTTVNFTGPESTKLRLEIEYYDGRIITRYIDTNLTTQETRLCANLEDVTHYEQLLISTGRNQAIIENIFSQCYVVADTTRFALQDALTVKAYTIASSYELRTFISGIETILTFVDGSIESIINLDVLEFRQNAFDLTTSGDIIATKNLGGSVTQIYYDNVDEDNTDVSLTIVRTDTNQQLYFNEDFSDQNTFTVNIDFSSFGINETTLLKATITKTNSGGTETVNRWFNIGGDIGSIAKGIAITLGIIITIFGLTIASSNITLSWFGIIANLVSLAILSQAVSTWEIASLQVINGIFIIFISVVLVTQNSNQVAGIR